MNPEEINVQDLNDEQLRRYAASAAQQAKLAAKLEAEAKAEVRRRFAPGTYRVVRELDMLISEPALRFQPSKVEELLSGEDLVRVCRLVPQRDLFEKAYGRDQLELVCTQDAARISFTAPKAK